MSISARYAFKFPLFSLLIVFWGGGFTAHAQPVSDNIQLASAQYLAVDQERVLDALVEAVHKATVSAQTSGRVSKIYYDVNDYVKKGAVLLRLRDKEQRARLNAAQAEFAQAESEYRRVTELFKKKLVAKSVLDKAESRFKSSRARLDQAGEKLERTIVRAPYSGIVVKRHIEEGETARPGVPLFTGLSLEKLRVAVNLPQDMINVVRKLKQARVISTLYGTAETINARSMTISPYADASSHSFLVRVNLPTGDHGLYPGMAVKVAFTTGKVRKLMVPSVAVSHRSEVAAVYVMDEKGKLSMRQVRIGQRINNRTEILSGLSENEQVALDPVRAVSYLKEYNPLPESLANDAAGH